MPSPAARVIPSLARTAPKDLWMSFSSTRMARAGLLTRARHALQQLRHVPYLEIGGDLAGTQVRRPVGKTQGSFPQDDRAAAHSLHQGVEPRTGRRAQRGSLFEADRRRIRIVDVLPVRAVPIPVLLVRAGLDHLDRFRVR